MNFIQDAIEEELLNISKDECIIVNSKIIVTKLNKIGITWIASSYNLYNFLKEVNLDKNYMVFRINLSPWYFCRYDCPEHFKNDFIRRYCL